MADQLVAASPNDADAASVRDDAARGLRDMQSKKIAEAEANAKRSGATDQDRRALADAYFDAGSYGAAADLDAHLPPADLTGETRLRYARSLAWSSQLDRAEQVYSDLLKAQSTPDLQLEYGRVLSWMGASKASVETLRSVYQTNPTEENAIALANAMSWSGDRQGAIKLLGDFDQSHPIATQAAQLQAQLQSSPELRLERVDKLIDREPYNLALQVERARLLSEAGRYAEELNTIKFVREHSRSTVEGLDALEADAKQHRQAELAKLDEQRAALDAQASMASSSQNADQVLSLAKAYTGVASYDRAESLYDRYLRMRPDDVEARLQYARVLSWD